MSKANYSGRRDGWSVSRRRLLRGAGAAGALALAACGGGRTSGQRSTVSGGFQPRRGGKVNVRMTTDPFDWDMSFSGKSVPNDFGQSLAYDTVLQFKHGTDVNYDASILQPGLAERWETPDAATYTFHLRPGVKFAPRAPVNGRLLTAGDIKWSYEYWSRAAAFKDNKKLPPSQYASYFEGLSDVQAPDDSTVVVHFSQPFVPFINYTGSYFNPIVPHEIYDQDGNLQSRIAGTGPWQLDDANSQKGSRWIWKRNPNYWNAGKPYIDEVDWIILTDEAAADAAFQAKQVDILGAASDPISAVSANQIKKVNPTASFAEYLPVGTSLYLNINTRMSPVKDVRVRQAISFALDRDEFIRTLSGGSGGWALSGAFPDTFTQDEIKKMLRYDPANAKQLLSAAGYANGVDIEFQYPGTAYGQDYISALQLLQAQLKKVGVNLNLKSFDKNAWTNNRKTYNFVMTGSAKADLVGDVDSWMYDFHSGNKSNYSQVSDPKLDALLDGSRRETDAAKRRDLIRQAIALINEQAYSLSVWTGHEFQFWQRSLNAYAPNFGVNTVPDVDSWVAG